MDVVLVGRGVPVVTGVAVPLGVAVVLAVALVLVFDGVLALEGGRLVELAVAHRGTLLILLNGLLRIAARGAGRPPIRASRRAAQRLKMDKLQAEDRDIELFQGWQASIT